MSSRTVFFPTPAVCVIASLEVSTIGYWLLDLLFHPKLQSHVTHFEGHDQTVWDGGWPLPSQGAEKGHNQAMGKGGMVAGTMNRFELWPSLGYNSHFLCVYGWKCLIFFFMIFENGILKSGMLWLWDQVLISVFVLLIFHRVFLMVWPALYASLWREPGRKESVDSLKVDQYIRFLCLISGSRNTLMILLNKLQCLPVSVSQAAHMYCL